MNIYFACSITGGREFESVYQSIVRALREAGLEVPTAHLAESGIPAKEAVIDPLEVYARDVAWIRNCAYEYFMYDYRNLWRKKRIYQKITRIPITDFGYGPEKEA